MVLNRNLAGDVYGFLPSSQPEEDELLQQRHTAGGPSKHGKKKLLIILHGKRIDDDSVRCAIQQIREEGHEVQVRVTWDSGDVDRFVREAVELWDSQSYDTLVAGGGDGTLNELVAALLKHDAPQHISIAQLPLGTANDLASATGISLHSLDSLRLALDPANIHPIDIALVNGEVFMNLTTAGPVSEVSSKGMSDTLKKALGPAAVAVAGFRQLFITGLQPIKNVKITYPKSVNTKHDSYQADQVAHIRGDLLVLAAGQARQMGRLINVCPDALLDDGLLDFTLLFGSAKRQAADLASDILSLGFSQAQGGVQLLRVPWMIVEADQDLKCNRDGEPSPPSKKLVFEVIPRRINLHLPDSRLLVDGQAAAGIGGVETADNLGGRTLARSWSVNRKKTMKTGSKPRPRLLLDLWKAQQPPGRLSRLVPKIKKLVGKTVVYGGLVGVGIMLGMTLKGSGIQSTDLDMKQQSVEQVAAVSGISSSSSSSSSSRLQAGVSDQFVDVELHQQLHQQQRLVVQPFSSYPGVVSYRDKVLGYTSLDWDMQQQVAARPNRCKPGIQQHAKASKITVCPMPRQSLPIRRAPPVLHARLVL